MTFEEKKNTKMELLNYLKHFVAGNEWESIYVLEQARAIFTTLCFIGDVMADTAECDNMLAEVYRELNLPIMTYEEFVNFMVELIV